MAAGAAIVVLALGAFREGSEVGIEQILSVSREQGLSAILNVADKPLLQAGQEAFVVMVFVVASHYRVWSRHCLISLFYCLCTCGAYFEFGGYPQHSGLRYRQCIL